LVLDIPGALQSLVLHAVQSPLRRFQNSTDSGSPADQPGASNTQPTGNAPIRRGQTLRPPTTPFQNRLTNESETAPTQPSNKGSSLRGRIRQPSEIIRKTARTARCTFTPTHLRFTRKTISDRLALFRPPNFRLPSEANRFLPDPQLSRVGLHRAKSTDNRTSAWIDMKGPHLRSPTARFFSPSEKPTMLRRRSPTQVAQWYSYLVQQPINATAPKWLRAAACLGWRTASRGFDPSWTPPGPHRGKHLAALGVAAASQSGWFRRWRFFLHPRPATGYVCDLWHQHHQRRRSPYSPK